MEYIHKKRRERGGVEKKKDLVMYEVANKFTYLDNWVIFNVELTLALAHVTILKFQCLDIGENSIFLLLDTIT